MNSRIGRLINVTGEDQEKRTFQGHIRCTWVKNGIYFLVKKLYLLLIRLLFSLCDIIFYAVHMLVKSCRYPDRSEYSQFLFLAEKKRSDLGSREKDSQVAYLELALIGTESFA